MHTPSTAANHPRGTIGLDLYWLPLGAGGRSVRWNGRILEGASALIDHRTAHDLYHSALVIHLPPNRYVVEMTPVWNEPAVDRGVVVEGPVGMRFAQRYGIGRYEVHCWKNGTIADIGEAVESPRRLATDASSCRRAIDAAESVPGLIWGRDERRTGERWNSNSVVAWVLMRSGVDASSIHPPVNGAAPGWNAGVVAGAFDALDCTTTVRRHS
ncbi:MAG: hypothetical protein V7694_03885 [Rhodococcus sp. (in: high G+C Gram-positive bacteria)]